jgi:hypothetical protein
MNDPDIRATDEPLPEDSISTTDVRGPLGVEKLEGRQEAGRDAQDEAEEDELADQ